MSETTITQLPDPSGFFSDPLTDVIRDGARNFRLQLAQNVGGVLIQTTLATSVPQLR